MAVYHEQIHVGELIKKTVSYADDFIEIPGTC